MTLTNNISKRFNQTEQYWRIIDDSRALASSIHHFQQLNYAFKKIMYFNYI